MLDSREVSSISNHSKLCSGEVKGASQVWEAERQSEDRTDNGESASGKMKRVRKSVQACQEPFTRGSEASAQFTSGKNSCVLSPGQNTHLFAQKIRGPLLPLFSFQQMLSTHTPSLSPVNLSLDKKHVTEKSKINKHPISIRETNLFPLIHPLDHNYSNCLELLFSGIFFLLYESSQ